MSSSHYYRERNREHAKRSRKRKKVYVETLQQSILKLQQDNGKLRSTITHLEQLISNANRNMEQQQQTQEEGTIMTTVSSSSSSSPNHVVSISPPLNPTTTSSSTSSSCPSFPYLNSSSTSSLSSYYPNNNHYYSHMFHNNNNYHHPKKDVSIIEHTLAEINNHNIAYKHRLHLLLPQTTVGNDLVVANPILTSID